MKVMLLAKEAPQDFALRDDEVKFEAYMGEWYAYSNAMNDAGVSTGHAAALEGPAAATVVSVRNGVRKVEDGPYPDTKEQLGGFFIIEVPDMDAAADWAAKCPAAKNGSVDVRAVPFLEDGADQ